jgi:hypothetical protein
MLSFCSTLQHELCGSDSARDGGGDSNRCQSECHVDENVSASVCRPLQLQPFRFPGPNNVSTATVATEQLVLVRIATTFAVVWQWGSTSTMVLVVNHGITTDTKRATVHSGPP